MLREVVRVDPELLQELEELENELFDNAFNAMTLGNELKYGGRLWVAETHCIEGYMLLRTVGGLTDILRLGVRTSFQGCGLGSAMLKCALDEFPHLMLCVRKSNSSAIRLYRRHGFQITGDLGESWTMQLTSSAS